MSAASPDELSDLQREKTSLEKQCDRYASCLQQLCGRLIALERENDLIRAELEWTPPNTVAVNKTPQRALERTRYFAFIDFADHYRFGKYPNVTTESHLSIPAILGEILMRIDAALYEDCQVDVLSTLKSRFLKTVKGNKNKKLPRTLLTAHDGEDFFVRADRKDHLQSLYGPAQEGLLHQLGLCPLLVRVGCEATKQTAALEDVLAPHDRICTCNNAAD